MSHYVFSVYRIRKKYTTGKNIIKATLQNSESVFFGSLEKLVCRNYMYLFAMIDDHNQYYLLPVFDIFSLDMTDVSSTLAYKQFKK